MKVDCLSSENVNLVRIIRGLRSEAFEGKIAFGNTELKRAVEFDNFDIVYSDSIPVGYSFFFFGNQLNPDLRRLTNILLDCAYNSEQRKKFISRNPDEFYSFYENDFTKQGLSLGPNDGYLYCLGVLPEFRGWGFGKSLMKNFIKKSKDNNSSAVYLDCWCGSPTAENFYYSLGFNPIVKTENYFEDGSASLFMGKRV